MMNDNYIDRCVTQRLLEEEQEERANHVSSGKLSASMLGQPLQWQILKAYGVSGKAFDTYTLRKFKRGKDIEKWLIEQIPNHVLREKQESAFYRDVVGYIDAMVDTNAWDFPVGIIPLEIKSVSNAKYRRIIKQTEPDKSHILQGALYALSENTKHFGITYVASDDLRTKTYILKTIDYKEKIDHIINVYKDQLDKGTIPVFVANEVWQKNNLYNSYPDWAELTQDEINEKFIKLSNDKE